MPDRPNRLFDAQRKSWRDPQTRRRRVEGLRRKWRNAEYRERIRQSVRRWASSPDGQAHLSANGVKTILLGRPGNASGPERAMAALLRRQGVRFRMHQRFGRYTADFVLPGGIILEVDDPRFHGSAEVRERDARKDAFLASKGFRVRRVSAPNVLRAVVRVAKGDRIK